jgi:hypothetical protein
MELRSARNTTKQCGLQQPCRSGGKVRAAARWAGGEVCYLDRRPASAPLPRARAQTAPRRPLSQAQHQPGLARWHTSLGEASDLCLEILLI